MEQKVGCDKWIERFLILQTDVNGSTLSRRPSVKVLKENVLRSIKCRHKQNWNQSREEEKTEIMEPA